MKGNYIAMENSNKNMTLVNVLIMHYYCYIQFRKHEYINIYGLWSAINVQIYFGFCRNIARTKTQQSTDKASAHNGRKVFMRDSVLPTHASKGLVKLMLVGLFYESEVIVYFLRFIRSRLHVYDWMTKRHWDQDSLT